MFNTPIEPAQRWNIFSYECVESTNTTAAQLIAKGVARDLSVVVAEYQTKGRGAGGNKWLSPEGENLLLSVIVFPGFLSPDQQFILNKLATIAITRCLEKFLPAASIRIKWPNDVYINRQKIAGILAENSVMGNEIVYCILGIGLNVNQTTFSAELPNPVSMAQVSGKTFNRNEILTVLLEEFEKYYDHLKKKDFALIDRAYLENLMFLGQEAEFMSSGRHFRARIEGVDVFGRLQLVHDGKTEYFDAKEITLIL